MRLKIKLVIKTTTTYIFFMRNPFSLNWRGINNIIFNLQFKNKSIPSYPQWVFKNAISYLSIKQEWSQFANWDSRIETIHILICFLWIVNQYWFVSFYGSFLGKLIYGMEVEKFRHSKILTIQSFTV